MSGRVAKCDNSKTPKELFFLSKTSLRNLLTTSIILQAYEFFLFAGLMFLDMFVLMLLAMRYKYVDYTNVEGEKALEDKLEDKLEEAAGEESE